MEFLGVCICACRLGWSRGYKSHLVFGTWVYFQITFGFFENPLALGTSLSFLHLHPHPCLTTIPPPQLVICLLWEGWAWEWKQNINWNSFENTNKTVGRNDFLFTQHPWQTTITASISGLTLEQTSRQEQTSVFQWQWIRTTVPPRSTV